VHRLKAIVVAIAMLAAPLALLARGVFCDPSECNCAVMCPMHTSHSQSQPMCGSARHASTAPMCGTHQGHHALDYGFLAPFAPGVPLAHAQLIAPLASSEFITQSAQFTVDGISSAPFEPPRS
jgi:hypothetical protein